MKMTALEAREQLAFGKAIRYETWWVKTRWHKEGEEIYNQDGERIPGMTVSWWFAWCPDGWEVAEKEAS